MNFQGRYEARCKASHYFRAKYDDSGKSGMMSAKQLILHLGNGKLLYLDSLLVLWVPFAN